MLGEKKTRTTITWGKYLSLKCCSTGKNCDSRNCCRVEEKLQTWKTEKGNPKYA